MNDDILAYPRDWSLEFQWPSIYIRTVAACMESGPVAGEPGGTTRVDVRLRKFDDHHHSVYSFLFTSLIY